MTGRRPDRDAPRAPRIQPESAETPALRGPDTLHRSEGVSAGAVGGSHAVTLVEFLNARYDEIEAGADMIHRTGPYFDMCPTAGGYPVFMCTCGEPGRIRARVTAARGIIRWITRMDLYIDPRMPLCCLAVEFATHPDYQAEWTP